MPEQSGIEIVAKDEFSKVFRQYDQQLESIEQHTTQAAQAITKSGVATKKQAIETGDLSSAMAGLAVKYAAVTGAVLGAYKAIQSFTGSIAGATQLAAQVETLGVSLERVGANAGYSKTELDGYIEALTEQGITTRAAHQSLLQMAQAQIDFTHASKLARIAQDAAVIGNINSSEAFQRMIYGIQSGQVEILRTIGLNVNFEQSYKKMAARLDVAKDKLSEQEKAQARANAVIETGVTISGTYEAAMGTVGKQASSMARHIEESQLIIGNVFKDSYGVIIEFQTETLKGFREWAAEHEDLLADLSTSFTTLVENALEVGKSFGILATGAKDLEGVVGTIKTVTDKIGEALYYLKQWIAFAHAGVAMYKTAAETAVKGLRDALKGGEKTLEDVWVDIATAGADKFEETLLKHYPPVIEKTKEEIEEKAPAIETTVEEPDLSEVIDAVQKTFDSIQNMQRDHLRQLEREEEDAARERARAWEDYEKDVAKAIKGGEKSLLKITESYEDDRAETIADYQEDILEAEREGAEERLKLQEDFARQQRQAQERYDLDRIQDERWYQYELNRLIAEGDTLAIRDLKERYAIEQEEAAENQDLQQRQEEENQTESLRETEQAATDELAELRSQFDEAMREIEAAYQEQIEAQQEANAERLAEMAEDFALRQRLEDEDRAFAAQRREEDYQRQLQELGSSLADQLREQEYGAEDVTSLLDQYYGAGGVADQVMAGFHEREEERIAVTAEMLTGLGEVAAAYAAPTTPGAATGLYTGGVVGMQRGGVVRGPATFHVEPGMVEAVVPLGGMTGQMTHSWRGGPIPITGLESASTSSADAVCQALARGLISEFRNIRRR